MARSTHTYAIADISQEAYDEIRKILVDAGYHHSIHDEAEGEVLDMHGVALRAVKSSFCGAQREGPITGTMLSCNGRRGHAGYHYTGDSIKWA